MPNNNLYLAGLGAIFGYVAPEEKRVFSALSAFKIAQRRLKPEVRSKLLAVQSALTQANSLPDAWRFLFLDPDTSGQVRVVTVGAYASSEHPMTKESFKTQELENVDTMSIIAQNKLLIDSTEALKIIETSLPPVQQQFEQTEYNLIHPADNKEPLWELKFTSRDASNQAVFRLSAKTGLAIA